LPATELFPRLVKPLVAESLDHARIVFVAGARQVGKTTLVTDVTRPDGDHPMRFVTLDDRAAREAAGDDPAGFVAGLGGPAVIDEIQHAPALCSNSSERWTRTPFRAGSSSPDRPTCSPTER